MQQISPYRNTATTSFLAGSKTTAPLVELRQAGSLNFGSGFSLQRKTTPPRDDRAAGFRSGPGTGRPLGHLRNDAQFPGNTNGMFNGAGEVGSAGLAGMAGSGTNAGIAGNAAIAGYAGMAGGVGNGGIASLAGVAGAAGKHPFAGKFGRGGFLGRGGKISRTLSWQGGAALQGVGGSESSDTNDQLEDVFRQAEVYGVRKSLGVAARGTRGGMRLMRSGTKKTLAYKHATASGVGFARNTGSLRSGVNTIRHGSRLAAATARVTAVIVRVVAGAIGMLAGFFTSLPLLAVLAAVALVASVVMAAVGPLMGAGAAAGGSASDINGAPIQSGQVLGTADPATVVSLAISQTGVRYSWGGTAWGRGLDCSGLVQETFRRVGISLPRTSQLQSVTGAEVYTGRSVAEAAAAARVGDFIGFSKTGSCSGAHHASIYVGGSQIMHCSGYRKPCGVGPLYGGELLCVRRFIS